MFKQTERGENVTRSDELLQELEESVSEYIKSIGKFQHENNNFSLVRHYRSEVYLNCEICGHERIIDTYVIKDESGKTWNVGNVCIEKLTNMKIKEWFENYQQKKDNIETNRELIDFSDEFVNHYDAYGFNYGIRKSNLERVRTSLERMCEGKNPTRTQSKLIRYYIRNKERYY